MKKNNKKLLTLTLAGALCATTLGAGLAAARNVAADDAAESFTASTYALTEVFASTTSGVIGADNRGDTNAKTETTKFTLAKDQSVKYQRNLALKWFDKNATTNAVEAQYLSLGMILTKENFEELTLTFETDSALATEDGKAVNTIKFEKADETGANVYVNGKKADGTVLFGVEFAIELDAYTGSDAQYGDYAVKINGQEKGKFTNVGAYYADYTYDKMVPLTIQATKVTAKAADATEEPTVAVYLTEINNQRFDNITTEEKVKKVADTTAPVLVVNDDIETGFLLGTEFSFSYETIDVLPSTVTPKTQFYQWNPADKYVTYEAQKSSPYFMDTVYYTKADGTGAYKTAEEAGEGYQSTTVYAENGEEYVSIKVTLADTTFKGELGTANAKKEYYLSWYVGANATVMKDGKLANDAEDETDDENVTTQFIKFSREEKGPQYNYIVAKDGKNILVDASGNPETEDAVKKGETALDDQVKKFQTELATAASTTVAGSNSYIKFPAMSWLLTDNNGYRNLKFTISYKSPSSTTAKSSTNLSYNGLQLSASEEGWYEFKVFAVDRAGNTMKYYLDGVLTDVSTSNVWEIEEIPSFTYEIKNKGLSVKTDSDTAKNRKDTENHNETYTFSDVKIVGASDQESAYALYEITLSEYNNTVEAGGKQLTQSVLTSVSYATIAANVKNKVPADGDYFALYLNAYITELARAVNGKYEDVAKCFKRIEEYNEKITENDPEWEEYNKYKWNATSKSFVAVEEDKDFLILADYWESELPMQRAAAYKVIEIKGEADEIKGDVGEWIKNNVVSVVLFSIAGVMLVLIIILLLVKPSDEKLEDVEENEEQKKAKKAKKEKKNK